MKSWRTTTLGICCLIFSALLTIQLLRENAWPRWSRPMESLHFWAVPFALYAIGVGLIHAADHKNLPPGK